MTTTDHRRIVITGSLDLDRIEAAARAATPGPWENVTSEATMNDYSEWRIGDRSRPKVFSAVMRADDAQYIALMDPATTLALVARLREALDPVPADLAERTKEALDHLAATGTDCCFREGAQA